MVTINDTQLKVEMEMLKVASEAIGDEVLTEWEEEFVESNKKEMERLGDKYELSEKREEVFGRIRRKLEKEGLL